MVTLKKVAAEVQQPGRDCKKFDPVKRSRFFYLILWPDQAEQVFLFFYDLVKRSRWLTIYMKVCFTFTFFREIFHALDANNDGCITEDEFVKGCLSDETFIKVIDNVWSLR